MPPRADWLLEALKFVGPQNGTEEKATTLGRLFYFAALTGFDRKRSVALLKQAGETLHLDHFFSLWSFGALRHLELDLLTLLKGLEAIALNGAVVYKDV